MTTGRNQGSQGSIPEIRHADPSNPRQHRRVSNRATKRARSHTAWVKTSRQNMSAAAAAFAESGHGFPPVGIAKV
jgi:hypothetical protein